MPLIESVLREEIYGSLMFLLCSKLKMFKAKLNELNKKEYWCLSKRVKNARNALESVQSWLVKHLLMNEEKQRAKEYRQLS